MAIAKVRGTRFYIGTTATVATSDVYVEITDAKQVQGDIGPESAEIDYTMLADDYKQAVKGVADLGDMMLTGPYDHEDPGQTALAAAAAPSNDGVYNIKVVQSNGRVRYVKVRVFSFRISYGGGGDLVTFKSKLSLTAAPTEVAA